MDKEDLELGNLEITQKSVQSLLYRVENDDTHKNPFSQRICMAPRTLRDLSPSSFNPRAVSIGPLHRQDENVQAFEGRKVGYLSKLLSRTGVPKKKILETCMQKVYGLMKKIKACYVWTKAYDDAEIAEMMVMDACFILEFAQQTDLRTVLQYTGNTLTFQNAMSDLMLLENQIPFFILDEIFQCTVLKYMPNASLIEHIYPVLRLGNLFKAEINTSHISIDTTHHILNLLHQCYKPNDSSRSKNYQDLTFLSAVDLDRAGVNFKPNQNPTWLMGMEVETYRFLCFFGFWSKATLRMPVLQVNDFTGVVLRNLIAYEHSFKTRMYITSYALTMDQLVNTQEDVAKLVESKVLLNGIGSNEEAASMINNVCKEVLVVDNFYHEQLENLSKYCNSYWPKNIAWLRRTYFTNPWNMIALLAGLVLFALTVVQTLFTIKST